MISSRHIVEEDKQGLSMNGFFGISNNHTVTILNKYLIPKNSKAIFNPDLEPIPSFWPNPDTDRIQNVNPVGL
jgi:hypothetical protein